MVQQIEHIQYKEFTKFRTVNNNLYICFFVDLTAAFDRIPRKWLFDSIRLRFAESKSVKLFHILEKLYQKTSLTYQKAQVTFLVTSGVRQGGPESPCLFILYIYFYVGFLSQTFTNHRTAGEGGGHFFDPSLPLPPALETLRH